MIDFVYVHPDRRKERIRVVSQHTARRKAEAEEREIRNSLAAGTYNNRKEVPTFKEWFDGRFWSEWVVAQRNKPSEKESKLGIYRNHLGPVLGPMRLDEMCRDGTIQRFRAVLAQKIDAGKMSVKTANNILAVLSKALRYAEEAEVIDRAPRVRLYKVEAPERRSWDFDEYVRLLAAARAYDPHWYAAVCLAGEAGLRIGEIRALRWERDIDLVAGTVTVNEQMRKGLAGTPKGSTRRTVPMTPRLMDALKGLSRLRRGFVVCNEDGSPFRDAQTHHAPEPICQKAGLNLHRWHTLRHTYATHAAMFGAQPFKLMSWLGHKGLTMTLRYIHMAEAHRRPLPPVVVEAGTTETDPDRRIVAMLHARGNAVATTAETACNHLKSL